jgi:hypothetical protein
MDAVDRPRAELRAESAYQAEMHRIHRSNKARLREHPHATHIERRSESDDEVRSNLPPNLVPLFERVKRGIKPTPRMTRTEAFLHYAEENADEAFDVLEEGALGMLRQFEQKEREAPRALRRGPMRRPRYTPEQLAEVPF